MTPPSQIRRILLPIDNSPVTQAAIDYAFVLARAMKASIAFIHVEELPDAIVERDVAAEPAASQRLREDLVVALPGRSFADIDTSIVTAATVAARLDGFDLIVMGAHARTDASVVLLGSIAKQLLRRPPCPVLTVHLPRES